MGPVVVFLAGPLVILVGLMLLPVGQAAAAGVALAALAVALGVPLALPEDGAGFGRLALWLYGGAVAAAGLVQALRLLRSGGGCGGESGVSWPLVAATVALATLPVAILLGLS